MIRDYDSVEKFARMVIPRGCVLCGKVVGHSVLLCDECEPEAAADIMSGCPRCAKSKDKCICAQTPEPWAFEGAFAALLYTGRVRDAIIRLRTLPDRRIARFLALETAALFRYRYPSSYFDIITELPAPEQETAKRGYSHTEMLAGGVAHLLKIPHRTRLLGCRMPALPPDSPLPPQERAAAERERYEMKIKQVAGRHLLLVDDIFITGASLNAGAKILLENGAASVFVLCAACKE